MMGTYQKSFLEQRQLGNDVGDCVGQGFVRRVLGRCLDANDELMLEWMGIFVAGKQHLGILKQLAEATKKNDY